MKKHIGIAVMGAVFVDIKGYPAAQYLPGGRNAGRVIQVHGGVSRNVAEDIANVELEPTFVTVLDETGASDDILRKLRRHRVNVDYVRRTKDGLGTWLAVFGSDGDVVASISQRPNIRPILQILEEHGEEIFRAADSICVEIDMDKEIIKSVFDLADRFGKKVYASVTNMSVAMERRDLFRRAACVVCNEQEAEMFFTEDMRGVSAQKLQELLTRKLAQTGIPAMVVTLGARGAVYAENGGDAGFCAARDVHVVDTTGAGDSFFAGVAIGLTYGKTLGEACSIGTRLSASVIATRENVCPRFAPEEFDICMKESGT
jgi:pseudouridine kinase